jgi:hypothetical protein
VKQRLSLLILFAAACGLAGCAGSTGLPKNAVGQEAPSAGSDGSNSAPPATFGAYAKARASGHFSLDPPRIHFASPQQHFKVERVRGFGQNGAIAENCIAKGVAEVAGTGLRGNTLIADVIPQASGRCEATFTDGKGAKLVLHVTIGP